MTVQRQVVTLLENQEMFGKFSAVREISGNWPEVSGKTDVGNFMFGDHTSLLQTVISHFVSPVLKDFAEHSQNTY